MLYIGIIVIFLWYGGLLCIMIFLMLMYLMVFWFSVFSWVILFMGIFIVLCLKGGLLEKLISWILIIFWWEICLVCVVRGRVVVISSVFKI